MDIITELKLAVRQYPGLVVGFWIACAAVGFWWGLCVAAPLLFG